MGRVRGKIPVRFYWPYLWFISFRATLTIFGNGFMSIAGRVPQLDLLRLLCCPPLRICLTFHIINHHFVYFTLRVVFLILLGNMGFVAPNRPVPTVDLSTEEQEDTYVRWSPAPSRLLWTGGGRFSCLHSISDSSQLILIFRAKQDKQKNATFNINMRQCWIK